MRRLTVSFHVTVANYEYLVYWRLYQDGNIECEIRATGIMVTTPFPDGVRGWAASAAARVSPPSACAARAAATANSASRLMPPLRIWGRIVL